MSAKLSKNTVIVVVLAALAGFAYGYLAQSRGLPPSGAIESAKQRLKSQSAVRALFKTVTGREAKQSERIEGRWRRVQAPGAQTTDEKMALLEAIGYMDGYEPAGDLIGVTRHEPELAYEGANLYTSGHAQEALLIDMDGKVLHRWAYDFRDAFPAELVQVEEEEGMSDRRERWRRAHVFENGDLLAIYEGFGLIKLDKDSKLLWAKANKAHHDLQVDEQGRIWVLTREAKVIERIHKTEPVLEDFISVLDNEGNEQRRVSLLEAFERTPFASHLVHMPPDGDIFHTNTIELLDGSAAERSPLFRKGNVLVSVRRFNVIAIVDMETERVVWALSGQWYQQHQPTLLESGRMLVFDNRGHDGMSKVVEIDPFTQEIVWAFEGDDTNGFHSETCGSNQRLPNGNTLISESDSGRAFEVTEDKRVVWEFYNPARAGAEKELIATLFEVLRLPPDFPLDWAQAPPAS